MKEITQDLKVVTWSGGRTGQQLLPVVYAELHRLARAQLARFDANQTLTPTELVHEVYLRIWGGEPPSFEGRQHFFFAVTRTMRDILVENIRRRSSLKRGGAYLRVELEDVGVATPREDVLALGRALAKLEREEPDKAQVVRLRYFGGFTVPEIADVTGYSQATVKRRCTCAHAWLRRELSTTRCTGRG